jgi:hypothetical protein
MIVEALSYAAPHEVHMMHPLKFSRALAWAGGVLLPIIETIRRWHQLGDPRMLPFWLDDWIIGLFLLYGA